MLITASEDWFFWFLLRKITLIEENFTQRSMRSVGCLGIYLHWPWQTHFCLGNENWWLKGKALVQKEESPGASMKSGSQCIAGDYSMGSCCNGKRGSRQPSCLKLNETMHLPSLRLETTSLGIVSFLMGRHFQHCGNFQNGLFACWAFFCWEKSEVLADRTYGTCCYLRKSL